MCPTEICNTVIRILSKLKPLLISHVICNIIHILFNLKTTFNPTCNRLVTNISQWPDIKLRTFIILLRKIHVYIFNHRKWSLRKANILVRFTDFSHCQSSISNIPLSTIWSRPPRSRSSSLNQSPARFEVRDSNVSIAKCPVWKS